MFGDALVHFYSDVVVKTYRVGGSVRDELLGRAIVDSDWVVVGATPEVMIAQGYRPVGRDFPVFLHPVTHEEYALARTERKQGRGYRGFAFVASPEVTLEQDLGRRDLTINAMARDENGALIDPYGGASDLAAGVLRHVSPAFAEDPLRVLRVARFAARFGFVVAGETEAFMRRLVDSGELAELSPERVWQELARGLMESQPSRMLAVLRDCGALAQVLPEVDALYGVPQPVAHHPEIDAGVHVALALDYAAVRSFSLPVRYAVLTHDLGKVRTPADTWPRHHAHEVRSVRLCERLSDRLRVPGECRDVARLVARRHGVIHRAAELRPQTLLEIVMEMDALRRPERLDHVLAACECDAQSRPRRQGADYAPAAILRGALEVIRSVDAGAIAAAAGDRPKATGDTIARAVRAARIRALRAFREGSTAQIR